MSHEARPRPLWTGLGGGACLALADWLATGVARTPAALVAASLVGGLVAGASAGAIGRRTARPHLAGILVLLLGLALEGLSVARKELPADEFGFGVVAVGGACAAACLLARLRPALAPTATWAAAAAVPLGAGFAARLHLGPWAHLTLAWPLVLLALWIGSGAGRIQRSLLWLVLAALAVQAQGGGTGVLERPGTTQAPPDSPSLVVLVVDTLRVDEVPPDGALARFGREGVVFEQCVSAAPWTLPSVASILTGRHPSEHGAVSAQSRLASSTTTLAEILRSHGYATGAFTGGAFVGTAHGLERGFDHFDPSCERMLTTYGGHAPLLWRVARNRYFPQRWLIDFVDAYRGLDGVREAATAWAAARESRPKFLLLHTYQVHDYYLYEPDLDDEILAATPAPSEPFAKRLWIHPSELARASQADLDHYRALYRGRIAALERTFSRLVAELTPLVGEDALWIITSDHGEGFDAAHRRVHHGGRLHEDLLRVPLVLRAKGRLEPGRVVRETVRTIDVLPTALDLLGLPVPEGVSGLSLLQPLGGEASYPATAFAEDRGHGPDLLAVRKGGWKWIGGTRQGELFHLTEDPLESKPVAGLPTEELRVELEGFLARHPPPARGEAEIDSTTLEHLRALGYTD